MTDSLPETYRGRRAASLVFGAYFVITSLAMFAFLLANLADRPEDSSRAIGLLTAVFSILGCVLAYRVPQNLIGWLFILMGFFGQLNFVRDISTIMLNQGAQMTFGLLLGSWAWLWIGGFFFSLLAFVFVLFPTGRLPSPRWRWAVVLLVAQLLLSAGYSTYLANDLRQFVAGQEGSLESLTLTPMSTRGIFQLQGYVRPVPELALLFDAVFLMAVILILLGVISQIKRFRQGDMIQRQQIKWLLLPLSIWLLAAAVIALPLSLPAATTKALLRIAELILLLVPVAIVLAILRYRLFDIDIIIRRTLLYGLLTAVLLAIYFGVVLLAQSAFVALTGQESPIAIVISTLVIAALFNPLRRRLQAFVDRRFYRRQYDASKTLESFAETARDEVDLEQLSGVLMRSVKETMQPKWAGLWLLDSDITFPETVIKSAQESDA